MKESTRLRLIEERRSALLKKLMSSDDILSYGVIDVIRDFIQQNAAFESLQKRCAELEESLVKLEKRALKFERESDQFLQENLGLSRLVDELESERDDLQAELLRSRR